MSICQEREVGATATVARELYDFGHQEGSTNRFYIKDHLGSVRGMVDDTGAITSAFDYDPYGRMTTLSGTETPSYGYAQLWHHQQMGLDLAVWRACRFTDEPMSRIHKRVRARTLETIPG